MESTIVEVVRLADDLIAFRQRRYWTNWEQWPQIKMILRNRFSIYSRIIKLYGYTCE